MEDREISDILIRWYEENKRDLPWRRISDPYLIWISEIILQQTRVVQALEYFNRFTERFPNVAALAMADEDEVMKYWQGLGYYSRARNLHAAAQQIMNDFDGVFPRTREEVLSLRGIGDYTAATLTQTKIIVKEDGVGKDLVKYFSNPVVETGTVDTGYDIKIIIGTADANN